MQEILDQLKLKSEVVETETNGTVSKYYLRLLPGAKVSKIENCAAEIAIGLKAYGKPLIKIIPERGLVCVELLTKQINTVSFDEFDDYFKSRKIDLFGNIPIILGRTHDGSDLIVDLSSMPHMLIAGTTGSGKSVLLHSILSSIIMFNRNIELALIDPKQVELAYYSDISDLKYPVVNSPDEAVDILSDLVEEMEKRFKLFNRESVNNIQMFNQKKNRMPYIVLVIDEFSDIMHSENKKEFQGLLCRLAQKSRACGIHIIIATQRPSTDVITGLIKSNFSARISCKVASLVDSRVILDSSGAERLIGRGDSLINANGFNMVRFQGAFIKTDDIQNLALERKRGALSKIKVFFGGI